MLPILYQLMAATVALTLGNTTLSVEVAKTAEAFEKGLQDRTSITDDEGMLFVYREPMFLSFWMKDTKVPLSIGFFDERRRLINVEDMNPPAHGQKESELPKFTSTRPAVYALEVRQGWFEDHNIKPGMTFYLE
ncbi:MAG: hypothetical protein RL235_108 [Chlamydiota bacterium]|jgi:uncharacterized membrane protein (UPF0127 family)